VGSCRKQDVCHVPAPGGTSCLPADGDDVGDDAVSVRRHHAGTLPQTGLYQHSPLLLQVLPLSRRVLLFVVSGGPKTALSDRAADAASARPAAPPDVIYHLSDVINQLSDVWTASRCLIWNEYIYIVPPEES